MLATNFEILNKRRSNPVGATDIKDFELRENGQIDAQEILTNGRITLYALDFENGQAVFLESTSPEELSQPAKPCVHQNSRFCSTKYLKAVILP